VQWVRVGLRTPDEAALARGCRTGCMEITAAQFAQIEHCLPLQLGNVSLSNLQVLNTLFVGLDVHKDSIDIAVVTPTSSHSLVLGT